MEGFNILDVIENEDGSLLVKMELSEFLRDLLISKGFEAIVKEYIDTENNES